MPTTKHVGVIWDMDGVILDSAEQHWASWRDLAAETGATFTREDFRRTFGQRNDDIIPKYWPARTPQAVAPLAERKEDLFRASLRASARALPGALELLRACHDAGMLQALGSSAPVANIQLVIELLGLGDLLEAAVSGEDAVNGKPAPDIFLAAARALGLAPYHCVVIEDAAHGVQAAKAAGMRCVAVTNGTPNAELRIADRVVAHLTDLTATDLSGLLD